jgi:hypothetical protein
LLHAVYIGGVFVAISLGMPAGVTALIVGADLRALFGRV